MFIEFEFGNFRSFRDLQKFKMEAAPLRSNDNGMQEDNVFEASSLRLLKSKAIYGRNASGKSNFAKAFAAFSIMVNRSVAQENLSKRIWKDRFQLLTDWDDQPIFFQYTFLHNQRIHRYGFQILNGEVSYEWLYGTKKDVETEYFMRTPETVKADENQLPGLNAFIEQALQGTHELYRKDSLFLTAAALNGHKILAGIREQIRDIITVDGVDDAAAAQYAMSQLIQGNELPKEAVKEFLKAADTSIEDLQFKKTPNQKSAEETDDSEKTDAELVSIHSIYDENGKLKDTIVVPFGEWESEGTGKLLSIGSLILRSLIKGLPIIIDEFDARLHPNITLKFIQLFHNKKTNPKNAQIIFITHDALLLRRAKLRRDQFCLVEKDKYGISSLTTLIEFKGVRKDASYDKEYLNGNYTGVPFTDPMDWVVTENLAIYNGLQKAE